MVTTLFRPWTKLRKNPGIKHTHHLSPLVDWQIIIRVNGHEKHNFWLSTPFEYMVICPKTTQYYHYNISSLLKRQDWINKKLLKNLIAPLNSTGKTSYNREPTKQTNIEDRNAARGCTSLKKTFNLGNWKLSKIFSVHKVSSIIPNFNHYSLIRQLVDYLPALWYKKEISHQGHFWTTWPISSMFYCGST